MKTIIHMIKSFNNKNLLTSIVNNTKNKILENKFYSAKEKNNRICLLNELTTFELGKFLLQNKCLNGYWTNYILTYPVNKQKIESSLERKMLTEFPSIIATQQRFNVFLQINQTVVKENCKLATIPSGLSNELLVLNYKGIKKFDIFAFDIDIDSLKDSVLNAKKNEIEKKFHIININAWDFDYKNEFDLLSCNGLTIYEKNDYRVKLLYEKFFKSLKNNGLLVTSTMTEPPQGEKNKCEWNFAKIDKDNLNLQNIVFTEIIGVKWQIYRSVSFIKSMLLEIGFKEVSVIYDEAKIFPTIIAKKLA